MNSIKIMIFLNFLLITINSFALQKEFNLKNQNVFLTVLPTWQTAPNFLSSSLTLFGPFENGKRPIIMLTESSVTDYILDIKVEKKGLNKFRSGRKKWMKKNKATLLKFYPYEVENWTYVKNIHTTGFEYMMLGTHYLESHYYLRCNSEIFHLSTLKTKQQNKLYRKEIKKILSSLRCSTKES